MVRFQVIIFFFSIKFIFLFSFTILLFCFCKQHQMRVTDETVSRQWQEKHAEDWNKPWLEIFGMCFTVNQIVEKHSATLQHRETWFALILLLSFLVSLFLSFIIVYGVCPFSFLSECRRYLASPQWKLHCPPWVFWQKLWRLYSLVSLNITPCLFIRGSSNECTQKFNKR